MDALFKKCVSHCVSGSLLILLDLSPNTVRSHLHVISRHMEKLYESPEVTRHFRRSAAEVTKIASS